MEQQQPPEHQMQDDMAYTNAIVDRLVEQYLTRPPLPSQQGGLLTIERFHRLYQCVMAEGYGR
jgi:hypothetical protein